MKLVKESNTENVIPIVITVVISVLMGLMVGTIIRDRHPNVKTVSFTVPSGKEQKFDIIETDSTIDIQLK